VVRLGVYQWYFAAGYDNIIHINNRCQFIVWLSFVLDRDWSNNMGAHGSLENFLPEDIQRRRESVPRGILEKRLQVLVSLSCTQMGENISKK
jgi:hypothetical protein